MKEIEKRKGGDTPMKKTLSVALMLWSAGIACAAIPTSSTPSNTVPTKPMHHTKRVACAVKGKTKMVKNVDACKDLGGKVVEAQKVGAKEVS